MMRTALITTIAVFAAVSGYYLGSREDTVSDEAHGLEKYDMVRVGDYRPPFSHGTINGDIDNIDNYTGKVVLVNFWATWCTPCREEMPMLQTLQQQYGARGFQVIGIALDDVSRVRGFVADLGIEYPNMVGTGDVILTGVSYGNSSGTLPYSVLIDREGIIRWRLHGEIIRKTFSKRLEQLL